MPSKHVKSSRRRLTAPIFRRNLFEPLEDRRMLSVVSWTGAGNSELWDNPANWSNNHVPTLSDDVKIDAAGSPTIVYDSSAATTTIGSISLAANDTLSVTGGSLTVAGGGASLTSTLVGSLSMTGGSLAASGAATAVVVSGPTTVSNASLSATDGAMFSLPGLTNAGDGVELTTYGTGSMLDVAAAASFGVGDALWDTNSATLTLNPALDTVDALSVTVDGTGSLSLQQFSSWTDGVITIEGGSYFLSNLNDIDGTSVYVQSGGNLSLPAVTSYSNPSTGFATFEAYQANSSLSLPNLAVVTGGNVSAWVGGTGSTLDLSAMISFDGQDGGLNYLTAVDGGTTILDPDLTSLQDVFITVDGTGNLPLDNITSLTNGNIAVVGGTYSLGHLNEADGDAFSVQNGGSLTLPAITSYSNTSIYTQPFQVSGNGSLLSLPQLTSISNGFVDIDASGAGNAILLPSLTSFTSYGTFSETTGARILFGALSPARLLSVVDVSIIVDGTSPLPLLNEFRSVNDGSITVLGGSYVQPNLINVDGSSLTVQNGGQLVLPAVTSYASTSTYTDSPTLEATGANSLLYLPTAATLAATSQTVVEALDGGQAIFAELTAIPADADNLQVTADGSGSLVDLSALVQYDDNVFANLQATNGGQILLPPEP